MVDGQVVRACLVLAVQVEGRSVTTIEALATPHDLHPVQEALRRHHGLQCGFCTPGIVLTAVDLLGRNPSPTEPEIREALAGNLCRCTGYAGIVQAVLELAERAGQEQ
jgi:carbon-monoxide dehydrogenase small subunit